jgi:hypothetical protein
MAAKRGNAPRRVTSKAQQGFLFATHKPFARKFAHRAGEQPGGSPSSKAAYRALPRRKGAKKR